MVSRSPSARIDPAADAAGLLRRLGFAILVFALPPIALLSRRAAVILVPIGTVLLVLAALLDGAGKGFGRNVERAFLSRTGIAALVLLGWAALSVTWTLFPESATEKIVNICGMVLLAAAGVASLPERMRSSNLYLIPVGAALAALLAIALLLSRHRTILLIEADVDPLDRGLVILCVALWPAVAWLVSRARRISALALALAVTLGVVMAEHRAAGIALLAGFIVYGVVAFWPRIGTVAVAVLLPVSLVIAPIIPFLLRPFLKFFHGPLYPGAEALRIWADVMGREPMHLITGHGLDTSLRARLVGFLPVNAPQTLPFEIWYELGVVGALSAAVALFFALTSSSRLNEAIVPGVFAGFASAFAIACVGTANAQAWWLSVLGAVVLTFVAVKRGQFRHSRPTAVLFGGKPRGLPAAPRRD